ncbi:ABC transporter substrate-binding protein [Paenibacillus sp. 79R4]|uniref:ABC transporter substrate-binding protein n=1 Tax=Paenibacillus sp. 79R4 TaxID=2212847 RepID=UPI0015BB1274|nr:ABC transporter substrate-binding protein [Paenibacillus sp. 79R4]NWL86183.1 ABC transporter substrate-binding protein [Paenibacillus sp. 79R4]
MRDNTQAKRTWPALLSLVIAVSVILAGCGSKKEAAEGSPSDDSSSAPYEITVAFFGSEQKDMLEVQEAMNKITKEKIHATVKLLPIALGNWQQQINLMMAGNEKMDLMFTSSGFGYSTLVAKGQLNPLNDLLDKYGQGIKQALDPAFLTASQINGEIYAVTTVRDLASDYGILMRKDLLDKYQIEPATIQSLDDLDAVFQTIKDKEDNLVPLVAKNPGTAPFDAGYITYDPLSGGVGVLPHYDNDLKVVNFFETKEYADELNVLRRWYQQGFMLKDAGTGKYDGREMVKAGKAFAYFSNLKPGTEVEASRKSGKEMIAVRLTDAYSTTDSITGMMWSIPKNSQDPVSSMKLLNLLYTDKELYNLFTWGIEGKHYVKVSDHVIDYPQGMDIQHLGYNFGTPYMFGNQFLSYTWKEEDPDIWSKMDEFNNNAKKSKALGFSFDVSKVKNEMAAVNNVLSEFRVGLETGTLDPAENLPKFIEKMKAAGSDIIVSEKQRQLDEWLKTRK